MEIIFKMFLPELAGLCVTTIYIFPLVAAPHARSARGNVFVSVSQQREMLSGRRYHLSSMQQRQVFIISRMVISRCADLKVRNLHMVLFQFFKTCKYCSWRACFFHVTLRHAFCLSERMSGVVGRRCPERIHFRSDRTELWGKCAPVSLLKKLSLCLFSFENSGCSGGKFEVSNQSVIMSAMSACRSGVSTQNIKLSVSVNSEWQWWILSFELGNVFYRQWNSRPSWFRCFSYFV